MSGHPDISIIIPTKNRGDVLLDTLAYLQDEQTYPLDKLEVNLINDGEPFSEDLTARYDRLNLRIFPNRASGAAAAKNTGIAKASHPLLLFLDDDMLVRDDHIFKHVAVHQVHQDVLVGGHWENSPKLVDMLTKTPFGRYKLKTDYHILFGVDIEPFAENLHRTNSVAGFNLSVTKEVMNSIGGFDENFPFTGHEDRDFSLRAMAKGYTLLYHTDALLYHNEFDRKDMQSWLNRKGRGQIGLLLLAERDPNLKAGIGYRQHLPIQSGDGWKLAFRKRILRLLSTGFFTRLLHLKVAVLEKILPVDGLLFKLYTALFLAYSQRGFEKGLVLLDQVKRDQQSA